MSRDQYDEQHQIQYLPRSNEYVTHFSLIFKEVILLHFLFSEGALKYIDSWIPKLKTVNLLSNSMTTVFFLITFTCLKVFENSNNIYSQVISG